MKYYELIKNALSGKKSYLLGVLGGVVVALWACGVLSSEVATPLLTALGFGSVITLRAAISKS